MARHLPDYGLERAAVAALTAFAGAGITAHHTIIRGTQSGDVAQENRIFCQVTNGTGAGMPVAGNYLCNLTIDVRSHWADSATRSTVEAQHWACISAVRDFIFETTFKTLLEAQAAEITINGVILAQFNFTHLFDEDDLILTSTNTVPLIVATTNS